MQKKLLPLCLVLCMLVAALMILPANATTENTQAEINASGAYSLFNSGATGSSYHTYNLTWGYDANPDSHSYSNNGYDIFGGMDNSSPVTVGMGIPFVVSKRISERATLTIYAYDVDEESGERDYIYLVDDTTGTRTVLGYLSGMNNQWNTTTLYIDPSNFTVGHTYHFENVISVSGWCVYVRTVSLEMTTLNNPSENPVISEHAFDASIDKNGIVTANLYLKTAEEVTYNLEYAASVNENQKGSLVDQTITATPNGVKKQVTFALESGSPKGSYKVDVVIKDLNDNPLTTYSATAGYSYSAVNYNSNGGSNQIPIDDNSYSSGDTVNVLFDYTPSKKDYTFIGWAKSNTATAPDYTIDGTNTFVIGSDDVTLYAVWSHNTTAHDWTKVSETKAGCTTFGEVVYKCFCGESRSEKLAPTGHNYAVTKTVEATCTEDGYIEFTCQNTGCNATKKQNLPVLGHDFGNDNTCDRCEYERNVHVHSYTENIVDPTCTAMGYTEYTCSCGYSYRDNYIEPVRHDWNSGVITTEATCTSDGLMTYTCLTCSAAKTEVIIGEHKWSEVVVFEKTCTEDGLSTKTCAVCGEIESIIVPAGHSWDEGNETLAPTCKTEGSKTCICGDCGTEESFIIPELGHNFVNGICTRCGVSFIEIVTPSSHPLYGMYFEIDDILSDYGPSLIDEYGVMLDYNSDANLEKVAVYLTQDGTMWRRCIAVKGTNITHATYVPYLSYQSEIKYTGLNHDWINIFKLNENSDGIWCYSNYATIGVNLEDAYGNLLLSLYDIGQAGAETRIFDDLDEMIAWLSNDCAEHTESEWITDKEPTCAPGSKHKECTVCGKILEKEEIPAVEEHSYSNGTRTDEAHPHKIYKVCICDAEIYSGTNTALANCNQCNTKVGDLNGDGDIGISDLVFLSQYIAGWSITLQNEHAADVNNDGKLNVLDLVVFAQFLAGWDVTLG